MKWVAGCCFGEPGLSRGGRGPKGRWVSARRSRNAKARKTVKHVRGEGFGEQVVNGESQKSTSKEPSRTSLVLPEMKL